MDKKKKLAREILEKFESLPSTVTAADWYALLGIVHKAVRLAELVEEKMIPDKVIIHRRFIPALNRVFETDTTNVLHSECPPLEDEHNDLVRLYPFPPKNEKGEYEPPIDLHDGVSEITYESGRVLKVIIQGCHSKERTDGKDKTPCVRTIDSARIEEVDMVLDSIKLKSDTYDSAERAAEKQASRDADAEALRNGTKTVAQLRAENGLIQVPFKIREKK